MLDPVIACVTIRMAANAIARTSTSGAVTAERLLTEARHAVAPMDLRLHVPIPDAVVQRSAAGYWDALAEWMAENAR